ncbi:hypothetical protein K4F52_003914 [Lecanicillium sp. MT-2017a]|nr:hypothetical protein K4F52_003914 [Lecanicillium sp. MT-2017a]
MGGLAFSSGPNPLQTPRMSPEIYASTKKHCIALLQQHYTHVASPVEAPAKQDHGDIDILACEPKPDSKLITSPSPRAQAQAIAELLGAVRSIIPSGAEVAANLAIPWPGKQEAENKHIQVDVRVCESYGVYTWMFFKHAHGDLWNMLGSLIRPYGLTVNDTGMYIRVPEIEHTDKNRARILLTSDPDAVLEFLGLPAGKGCFDEPFASLDALFAYVAQCRMMYIPAKDDSEETKDGGFTGDPKSLKANDRRRMKFRPVYKQWVEEYIPQCRAEGKHGEQKTNRAKITDEALERFGVREEYTRVRHEFLLERQRDTIWNDAIKNSVPAADPDDQRSILYRACLVKALKRVILERNESYDVKFDEAMMGEDGFYNMGAVRAFIQANKDDIGRTAMRKHHESSEERFKNKQAAKKQGV